MSNSTAELTKVSQACETLQAQLIHLVEAFLWIALIFAVLTTLADLAVKLKPIFVKERGFGAARAALPVDPVKFLDALKGVIEALTSAPAWVAMFLAGIALLWSASAAMPEYCKPARASQPERRSEQPSQPNRPGGAEVNSQVPADRR